MKNSNDKNQAMTKKILLSLIVFCAFQSIAIAGEPIEVSIAVKKRGDIIRPISGTLIVGRAFPTIVVIVENVSNSSQKLYTDYRVGKLGTISFEVKDRSKRRNVIKRKVSISKSSMVSFQHMQPGDSEMFEVVLDKRKWENAFKLYDRGSRAFKARAIFYNGTKKLYSPYYDVIVEEKGW